MARRARPTGQRGANSALPGDDGQGFLLRWPDHVLSFFLIGAAIGALTGVPIGPVNVAVIESAYRHNLRRAVAVGGGGALADAGYAGLGILGVGPFLRAHSSVPPILFLFSGVVLVVYGILTVRTQPAELRQVRAATKGDSERIWTGFLVGVSLILLNPAAIITWVVIVGSFFTEATRVEAASAALGVGAGSFLWFSLVAYLADHGKRVLGSKAVWIMRVVGVLLIGYGVFLLGRAGYAALHAWDVL
jgi:threonine/homoserine/homoserine lactone efflux protein